MAKIRKPTPNVGKGVRQQNRILFVGIENGILILENVLAVSYKCKHLSYTPSIPPLDNLP